ncbi:MAG: DUF3343 domain-containing protein [Clostridia bacterium]|nr:DUF3343 domain-containing protein [Clostridia bacterium]
MREKSMRLVVTFKTTTDAIAMETACRESGLAGRLIPVPREITAGCGMAWLAPVEDGKALADFMRKAGLYHDGWYEMML